jgi:hypothetical protein
MTGVDDSLRALLLKYPLICLFCPLPDATRRTMIIDVP